MRCLVHQASSSIEDACQAYFSHSLWLVMKKGMTVSCVACAVEEAAPEAGPDQERDGQGRRSVSVRESAGMRWQPPVL